MSESSRCRRRPFRSNAPWLAGLTGMAALLAFLPALFGRTVVDAPEVFDLGNQWIGFAAFIRRCFLSGRFPLWDPHDLCGMPFLAFAHTGSLYWPWVLVHLGTAFYHSAAALDIFIHLALAALAAFALFRIAGRSSPAAFCGAVAYAFSGFVFGNINFPPSLHTAAWLAVWYAAGFSMLARPRTAAFFLSALSVAAMITGGDLELVIYAGLGLGFEIILRQREKTLGRAGLAALAGSIGVGAVLGAAQILPALEFNNLSIRAGQLFTPEVNLAHGIMIPLYALFSFPLPAFLYPANHGLDPWYLGFFFLLLAAYGVTRFTYVRRRLLIFPAAVLYLIFFYTPAFHSITAHIPVLGAMMVPFRVWPVLEIFFLLAATHALDQWRQGGDANPEATALPWGRVGAVSCVVFGSATAISLIWIRHGLLPRLLFSILLVALGLVVLRKWPPLNRLSARTRSGVAVALVLLDLYGLALAWLPQTDPGRLNPDPRLIPFLQNTSGQARYLILSIQGILDAGLPYHLGLRLQADTIDAFSRIPPRAAARRLAMLYPSLLRSRDGRLIQYDQMSVRDPKNLDHSQLELLNRMNVTWILSRFPWQPAGTDIELATWKVYPDLYIYQNLKARPRARAEIWGQPVSMSIQYPAPDQVELSPSSSLVRAGAGILSPDLTVFLADSWYPGWEARSDGQEVKIEADELGFRRLTASGAGTIHMRFAPKSFRIGLWSSLVSIFALGLMALLRIIPLTGPGRT